LASKSITEALFHIGNLQAKGFFDIDGKEVIWKEEYCYNRPAGLFYFWFQSTDNLRSLFPAIIDVRSLSFILDLPLHQTSKRVLVPPKGTTTPPAAAGTSTAGTPVTLLYNYYNISLI
jgi:hypothetical protein